MRNDSRRATWTLAAAVALLAGCDSSQPGAGFTNGGTAPTMDPAKPSARSDMPAAPDAGHAEVAGEAAGAGSGGAIKPGTTDNLDPQAKGLIGSDTGGTGTNAGDGGRNAGRNGSDAAGVRAAAGTPPADAEVRATPPTTESPTNNTAAGSTKPQGSINAGTPRSPQ